MKREFIIQLQTTTNPQDFISFELFMSATNGNGVCFESVNFITQQGQLPILFQQITKREVIKDKQGLIELLNAKLKTTSLNHRLVKEGEFYSSIEEFYQILVDEYEKLAIWEIEMDVNTREKYKVELFNSL